MEYTDETLMPWGVHKGKPLDEIPARYFLWVEVQPWFDPANNRTHRKLNEYIQENRDVLDKEAAQK